LYDVVNEERIHVIMQFDSERSYHRIHDLELFLRRKNASGNALFRNAQHLAQRLVGLFHQGIDGELALDSNDIMYRIIRREQLAPEKDILHRRENTMVLFVERYPIQVIADDAIAIEIADTLILFETAVLIQIDAFGKIGSGKTLLEFVSDP